MAKPRKKRTYEELDLENLSLRLQLSRACRIIESARQLLSVNLVDPGMVDRVAAHAAARGLDALIPTKERRT